MEPQVSSPSRPLEGLRQGFVTGRCATELRQSGRDASIFVVGYLNVAVLGAMVWIWPRFLVATAEFSGGGSSHRGGQSTACTASAAAVGAAECRCARVVPGLWRAWAQVALRDLRSGSCRSASQRPFPLDVEHLSCCHGWRACDRCRDFRLARRARSWDRRSHCSHQAAGRTVSRWCFLCRWPKWRRTALGGTAFGPDAACGGCAYGSAGHP